MGYKEDVKEMIVKKGDFKYLNDTDLMVRKWYDDGLVFTSTNRDYLTSFSIRIYDDLVELEVFCVYKNPNFGLIENEDEYARISEALKIFPVSELIENLPESYRYQRWIYEEY